MDLARLIRRQLEVSEKLMLGMVNSVDGQGFMAKLPGQGESMNWVFGHIAVNEDWFISLLTSGETRLDQHWHRQYGPDASPPVSRHVAVPRDEICGAFKVTRQRLYDLLDGEDLSTWKEPAPIGLPSVFETRGDVWGLIGSHPYWHVGHLATIRPMLSLKPYSL